MQKEQSAEQAEWKKIFTTYTSDKVLISRIYTELKQISKKNNKQSYQKSLFCLLDPGSPMGISECKLPKEDLKETSRLLHSKINYQKVNRHPTEWEKMLTSYASDKSLIFRIYKELKQFNKQNTTNHIK
ncbi:retrotransposable element ORF2 protein, partial [Plecturocebus cupreus]